MADRNSDNWIEGNWIEKELTRQLSPVAAPRSLWSRIESARRPARTSPQAGWILWPAVATMLLFASGDLLWEIGKARASLAPLTQADLEAVSDHAGCDFKSSDPDEIRRWVKGKTNIDVNLSCGRAADARPVGASLIRKRGATIAAIAYRVGNDAATLFVSDRHSLFRRDGDYSVAWSAREPAGRDNPEACNRCHVDARSRL